MKRLRFPNDNTLILLNKGGSSFWGWIIKFYSDWKGIPIRVNEVGKGKKILIVRNPYQRFLSGFLHQSEEIPKGDEVLMNEFQRYMERCWSGEIESEIEGSVDYHLWRAGKILEREGITPTKVLKIEEIEEEMENWGKWGLGAREPQWGEVSPPHIKTDNPNPITELELPYEGWDGHFLKGLWLQSKENVRWHHRDSDRERLELLLESHPKIKSDVNKWVGEEMLLWGYKRMI